MIGSIGISNHRVSCIIGIYPRERAHEQEILVNVHVKANFSASIQSAKVEDTVNYVALADLCTQVAQTKKHQLLEGLAFEILQEILARFPVQWASIRIKKPGAIPSAEDAWIELEQEQK